VIPILIKLSKEQRGKSIEGGFIAQRKLSSSLEEWLHYSMRGM
jgi:hypothetical protein